MKYLFILAGVAASLLQLFLLKLFSKKENPSPFAVLLYQLPCPVVLYLLCKLFAPQYVYYALISFIVSLLLIAGANAALLRRATKGD